GRARPRGPAPWPPLGEARAGPVRARRAGPRARVRVAGRARVPRPQVARHPERRRRRRNRGARARRIAGDGAFPRWPRDAPGGGVPAPGGGVVRIAALLSALLVPSVAAQGALGEAARAAQAAWLAHNPQALVGQSASVALQIPGADASAPLGRAQAIELLRR